MSHQRLLQALQAINATVGLYALEVEGYTVTSIDPMYGGGFEVETSGYKPQTVLRNAKLEAVAEFLMEHTDREQEPSTEVTP